MAKRPEPSESVVKTLFALSANLCGFSDPDRGQGCEQKLTDPSWKRVNARIAHIRGLLPGSARYDPAMSDGERNAFENLLLLCPNHHTLIDDLEPDRYTAEVLTEIKARAERREDPGRIAWASDAALAAIAHATLTQMRQTWWGWRHLPIVRGKQIQVGSVIEYEGQPVTISAVERRADGASVHLTFSEPVITAAGTIVGWDLADDDPLNIHSF